MLYRFRCKAAGDTLMLQPQAEQFLRALGREPAARGILEPADMGAALEALQRAVEDDERARASVQSHEDTRAPYGDEVEHRDGVSLRQRLWPMVEMIERARSAGQPIVWGV